ncbi:hypothetical protein ES703_31933 [subsurface metagenome]
MKLKCNNCGWVGDYSQLIESVVCPVCKSYNLDEVVEMEHQPTIYIQPRAGITELSKKFVEEHLPKIGAVSEVFCYINDRGDYITSISGSKGGIIVDGFSWGYAGEGPHGFAVATAGQVRREYHHNRHSELGQAPHLENSGIG